MNIVVGAPREVAGELKITGTDLRPFFNRLFVNLGPFCTWDRGGWNGAKTVYTVTGTVGLGIEGDPLFVVTLAMPRDGTFTMHVGITDRTSGDSRHFRPLAKTFPLLRAFS